MTNEELQQHIAHRTAEIAAYQANIDNYTAMLHMLPSQCPAKLQQYQNSSPVDLHGVLPFEDIQLISDLQYRARLERLLLTEKLEQRKVNFVLQALQEQLG